MPQSLVKNYIHITFSTKNRAPLIDKNIKSDLFQYIGGICKNLECFPIMIGGYKDHVHIFCLLSRKITLVTLLEKVKSNSSKWIKDKGPQYKSFYWQNGYGAFSVDESRVEVLKDYINNQVEHHRKKSYKEEFITFLNDHRIEYDDRYVWD